VIRILKIFGWFKIRNSTGIKNILKAEYLSRALIAAISISGRSVYGQDRAKIVTTYKEHYTGQRPIYQAAPVTHVVPEFNQVTYVLDARQINTVVTTVPASSGYGSNSSESLTVKGYRASPYLALSLKRVGIGFNLEAGESSIAYKYQSSSSPESQASSVSYRGLGIYGFYKVFDGDMIDVTMIGGGRSTNAKHKVGMLMTSYNQNWGAPTASTYRYSLSTYEAGLNTQIHILKSVTMIPWVNYSRTDTANAAAQVGASSDNDALMVQDLDVFWKAQRTVDYGIDLGVRVGGFEVHVGGMLGSVFNSAGGSEEVKDKGYAFSLSLHQKG
jgi:hypothetical protein